MAGLCPALADWWAELRLLTGGTGEDRRNFEAGVPKDLFHFTCWGGLQLRRHYSVSPDGQRFLVNSHVAADRPRTILLYNWLSRAN